MIPVTTFFEEHEDDDFEYTSGSDLAKDSGYYL